MARGVDGRDVFIDAQDRHVFIKTLARIKLQTGAAVYAYCLMGNHFHLAIKVESVELASVMQRLLTLYSITFNSRHGRTGHLFQARYKAILCLDDSYLIGLIRYIHLNPVRAGLAVSPDEWPWSSYNDYQKAHLDGLVISHHDMPDFDPWKTGMAEARPTLMHAHIDQLPPLSEIGASVSTRTGISVGELRSGSKRPDVVVAKRLLIVEAVKSGHRLLAIANWLGNSLGAISHHLRTSN